MAIAVTSSCSGVNYFESLQEEWPELSLTYSRHNNKSKSPTADNHCHTKSSVQNSIDYFSENYFLYDSVHVLHRICSNNAAGSVSSLESTGVNIPICDTDLEYRPNSSSNIHSDDIPSSDVHYGNIRLDVTISTDCPSCDVHNVDVHRDAIHSNVTISTDILSSELNLDGSSEVLTKKKKRKAKRRIRSKSTKKWKTLDTSQFGFHISRFPATFVSCDEADSSLIEVCSEYSGNETCCDTMKTEQLPSNEDSTLTQDSVHLDDISFFRNMGIDVINDLEVNHLSQDISPRSHILEIPGKLHSQVKSYFSEIVEDFISPSYDNIPFRKKCDKYKLYDLECVPSRKVQIRPDRHRRVEKAHKAVKSKNMKSLSNNKGRKTLYMHHRLVKKHNLDLDFRHFAKAQRFSAMTKKSVDTSVAKQLFKADARGRTPHNTDAPPVQNLKHALHETNAPTQMDTDLANFLIVLQHRDLTPEDYDMLLLLDDSIKPKTVSNNVLSLLRTELIGPEGLVDCEEDTLPICTICMELYTAGQTRKFLPCSHYFHSNCIDSWLKNSSMNCPLDGLPIEPS